MPLKDFLKKRDKLSSDTLQGPEAASKQPDTPQFTFLRTTTDLQETIEPPSFPDDTTPEQSKPFKLSSHFRKHSTSPATSATVRSDVQPNDSRPRDPNDFEPPKTKAHERKLSERLHLHSRASSRSNGDVSSVNVPSDLPQISNDAVADQDEEGQAQWEARATILAKNNGLDGRGRTSSRASGGRNSIGNDARSGGRSRSRSVSDERGDANIQQAIELHERGDLERSTKIFGILADSKGANNALSQVLYGLALR